MSIVQFIDICMKNDEPWKGRVGGQEVWKTGGEWGGENFY
jgi:hypothetical protein